MDAPRTLLLDSASLYFRAFFGLPDSLRSKTGDPVNAVRGLLDFIARFVTDYSPTHLACCWDDAWRPAWRVALVPSYKAHRVVSGSPSQGWIEEVPEALTHQVPWIRATLDALGLPIVGAPDFEADDVIATLATGAGQPVDVVTGDRDLFQLADDANDVRVLYVGRGVAKHEQVTDAWLQAKYGITGAGYVDFAVMRGDPSDGLPGVKGIVARRGHGLPRPGPGGGDRSPRRPAAGTRPHAACHPEGPRTVRRADRGTQPGGQRRTDPGRASAGRPQHVDRR